MKGNPHKNRAWSPPLPFPPSRFLHKCVMFFYIQDGQKKICARGRGGAAAGGEYRRGSHIKKMGVKKNSMPGVGGAAASRWEGIGGRCP